jgi:hypothetical protein
MDVLSSRDGEKLLREHDLKPTDLGTHSVRKGATTFCFS